MTIASHLGAAAAGEERKADSSCDDDHAVLSAEPMAFLMKVRSRRVRFVFVAWV